MKRMWKALLLAVCLTMVLSVSAFAENRYTCILEGKSGSTYKTSSLAYMKKCRISGNEVIVKGQMGKIDSKTHSHVKRKTYKKKTTLKLAKNVKFYTESIEGKVKVSKKKFVYAATMVAEWKKYFLEDKALLGFDDGLSFLSMFQHQNKLKPTKESYL